MTSQKQVCDRVSGLTLCDERPRGCLYKLNDNVTATTALDAIRDVSENFWSGVLAAHDALSFDNELEKRILDGKIISMPVILPGREGIPLRKMIFKFFYINGQRKILPFRYEEKVGLFEDSHLIFLPPAMTKN